MITYLDTKGKTHEKRYDNGVTKIDLSHQNITQILSITGLDGLQYLRLNFNKITEIKGLDGLINLQLLALCNNQITELKGLDKLTNLQKLGLDNNNITEIKGLDELTNLQDLWLNFNKITEIKGLDKLINLQLLALCNNQITEIKGLNRLTNLQEIWLSNNHITGIKGLNKLTNLQKLWLAHNKITEIKGLDKLTLKGYLWSTNLQRLGLNNNQITEIKGLDGLTNLQDLWLSNNQITEIKGLDGLTNLQKLVLNNNQITKVPFTIMNIRGLNRLCVDCDINVIIKRFLNRNRIRDKKTIYDDSQNVHDSNIVKSVKQSIYNIIKELKEKSIESVLKEIINDKIIVTHVKEQLVEYCQDKTVHSILNLTFDEVLCGVWGIISEHKESDEIKKILNIEMQDSMCKCFSGRLSRLVNCLNGFDERVSIKINENEQILNIIIGIRNKYDNLEKQKEETSKELTKRGFDKNTINEYIIYLE